MRWVLRWVAVLFVGAAVGCTTTKQQLPSIPTKIFPGPTVRIANGQGQLRAEIFYTRIDSLRSVQFTVFGANYRLLFATTGTGKMDSSKSLQMFLGRNERAIFSANFFDGPLGRSHLLLSSAGRWTKVHSEGVSKKSIVRAVQGWSDDASATGLSLPQLALVDSSGQPVAHLGGAGPVASAALIFNPYGRPAAVWQVSPNFDDFVVLDSQGDRWLWITLRVDRVPEIALRNVEGDFLSVNGNTGELLPDPSAERTHFWPEEILRLRSVPTPFPLAAWDGNGRLLWRGP